MNISMKNTSFEILMDIKNEYLSYVVLNIFGSIFGVIGSIAIITAILITKELQNRTNLIIANIASVDFILSSLVDSFAITGLNNILFLINFIYNFNKYIKESLKVEDFLSINMVYVHLLVYFVYVHVQFQRLIWSFYQLIGIFIIFYI
jgi:tetrahydromethanopterin S-methyltransferase subunit C